MLVDLLEIRVLSRKGSPPEVAGQIDAFLMTFRERLDQMPVSEIKDHVAALSTKLLKQIQTLQSEAFAQFAKIRRYSLEKPYLL